MKQTTVTFPAEFDTLDIAQAHYLFWSEHHTGQFSEGYAKLCQAERLIRPGMMGIRWETLCENAQNIYRNLCEREGVPCPYETITSRLEDSCLDASDDCILAIVERFDNDPECLIDFEHSDWVNIAEPYTRDLLNRWRTDQASIQYWFDQYCEAIGATSTLEALEGQTIDDPNDMATAMVNLAMSYCATELLRVCFPDR